MSRLIPLFTLVSLCGLSSCKVWNDILYTPSVVPKGSRQAALAEAAQAEAQANQPVAAVKPVEKSTAELPETPRGDDGVRLPDMLNLPSEGEFRSTNPDVKKPTGDGAVISRPPTDPPSRPKPTEKTE